MYRLPVTRHLGRPAAWAALLAAAALAGGLLTPATASAAPTPASGTRAPASGTRAAHATAAITPPQHDPFYKPPAGWAATAPGTILRSRPVNLAALGFLPQNVQAWQVLYRTTGYNGKPMATVTTLVRPSGPAPQAVVSYQIAEDASAPQCAPSYALRPGVNPGNAVNQAELVLIDTVVAKGFAVSIPDYEGPDGEFGAPDQPGYAILDGLRAAMKFHPLGLPGAGTPAAIWGYSGGSLASGWAAQVQPSYAPDINLRGVAVGGFVTNLAQVLTTVNGGIAAGLIPSALPGLLRADPALATAIHPYLTAAGQGLLAKAGSQCETTNVTDYPFLNISNYLTEPLATVLALPAVQSAMAPLNLGGSAPDTPMFVYHAVNDELVPIAGPDAIVPAYCAQGDSITYYRDDLSDHATLAIIGAPAALAWISQRLDGGTPPRGCTTTTVPSMLLIPPGLASLPSFLTAIVAALLDQPIGPGNIF
jgi:hypothetical protein